MEQNTNVCTSYYSIECYTVQKTKPLAWLSTVDTSSHFDYSYAHIYQLIVAYFVVEIHHGDILYFPFCLNSAKQQKTSFDTIHHVVRENLNYGLHECRIFSCDNFRWCSSFARKESSLHHMTRRTNSSCLIISEQRSNTLSKMGFFIY